MISFPFMSRDKRSKPVTRSRSPSSPSSTLEQQLFGKPRAPLAHRGAVEIGLQDWVKSSTELRDGCDVKDMEFDTLPGEFAECFRR